MATTDLEAARCDPITGEPARWLFDAQDNRGFAGTFSYWEGPQGHVFLDPVPADLGGHYAGGYQPIPQNEQELAQAARADAYRLEPILQRVPQGTFLEIGCWIGLTAYSARMAGYDVSVLERDGDCVGLLSRCGIDAMQSSDPAASLRAMGRTFDVIGMWHSIEHLPRPWDVIEAAAQSLNPGGLLLIAAPNPESAQFRVLGKHWVHLDAPRHLHFLPLALVEAIGSRNGLTTVERGTDDPLGLVLEEHGWRWELHRRVGRIFGLRALAYRFFWRSLMRKHRRPGTLDGAGYTLIMAKPPLAATGGAAQPDA